MSLVPLVVTCLTLSMSMVPSQAQHIGGCCYPDQQSGIAYNWETEYFRFYANNMKRQTMMIGLQPNVNLGMVTFIDYNTQTRYIGTLGDSELKPRPTSAPNRGECHCPDTDAAQSDVTFPGLSCHSKIVFPKRRELYTCIPESVMPYRNNGTHAMYQFKESRDLREKKITVMHADNNKCIPITSLQANIMETFLIKKEFDDQEDIDHKYFNNVRDRLVKVCEEGGY